MINNMDKYLIGTILLILLLIAFYSTPFADDFCKHYSGSLWDTIVMLFNSGDGRFLSFSGFFMALGFKYLSYSQMSIFWLLFFLSTIFLMVNMIYKEKFKAHQLLLVLTLFVIGSESTFNEVVFWATGGSVYSVSTFFALLYLLNANNSSKINIQLLITPLFVTLGPNYTIPILFIVIVNLLFMQTLSTGRKVQYILSFTILFVAGLLIIVMSPGTETRLGTVSTFWMWHPRYIIEAVWNVIQIGFINYYMTIPLIIIVLIKEVSSLFVKSEFRIFKRAYLMVFNLRYFFAALLSLLVFVKTPGLLSGRAAYFFYVLIFIQFLNSFKNFSLFNYRTPLKVIAALLIIVLTATFLKTYKFNKSFYLDLNNTAISKRVLLDKYAYNNINEPFKRTASLPKTIYNEWAESCFENYFTRSKSE